MNYRLVILGNDFKICTQEITLKMREAKHSVVAAAQNPTHNLETKICTKRKPESIDDSLQGSVFVSIVSNLDCEIRDIENSSSHPVERKAEEQA